MSILDQPKFWIDLWKRPRKRAHNAQTLFMFDDKERTFYLNKVDIVGGFFLYFEVADIFRISLYYNAPYGDVENADLTAFRHSIFNFETPYVLADIEYILSLVILHQEAT